MQAVRRERRWGRVFVTGDFNVGYEADLKWHLNAMPYKRFGAIGLTSMWKGSTYLPKPYGTHEDALIDQVWTTRPAETTTIVRNITQSDHFPAVATYTPLTLPVVQTFHALGSVKRRHQRDHVADIVENAVSIDIGGSAAAAKTPERSPAHNAARSSRRKLGSGRSNAVTARKAPTLAAVSIAPVYSAPCTMPIGWQTPGTTGRRRRRTAPADRRRRCGTSHRGALRARGARRHRS